MECEFYPYRDSDEPIVSYHRFDKHFLSLFKEVRIDFDPSRHRIGAHRPAPAEELLQDIIKNNQEV